MEHRLNAMPEYDTEHPQSSYSALTLHRKCPQAWTYRYGMRLAELRDTPSPYLVIGRWWSVLRALEAIHRGKAAGTLKFAPEILEDREEGYSFTHGVTVEEVLEESERRWARMSADMRDDFVATLGEPLHDRLRGMYVMWDAAHQDRHANEAPIGVEMFWERDLPQPANDAAWSLLNPEVSVPVMKLIGYVDELYLDRARDMLVIRDDKALKDLGNVTSGLDDLMDAQLMLYVWGTAPMLKEAGYPAPRAIEFDRVRSVAPKSPQLTATGTLSKSVTSYNRASYEAWAREDTANAAVAHFWTTDEYQSLTPNQRMIVDELGPGRIWGKLGEFYVTGAKKGMPKFGVYEIEDKVLEHLDTPTEQGRWLNTSRTPVNKHVLRAHLRSAVDTARDIFQTQKRVEATGEAARNLDRRGCQWCPFSELCRAQLFGGTQADYDVESFGLRKKPERSRAQ